MQSFRNFRNFVHNVRHGWLSVTVFYLILTALAYAAYFYFRRLPEATGVMQPGDIWAVRGDLIDGLRRVWFIFAWGFGIQLLLQIGRIIRRYPRDAGLVRLFRHGAWMSAHAGVFEEIIFRLYAFLCFVIGLRFINDHTGDWLRSTSVHALLPAANFISFGLFHTVLASGDWAVGVAVIVGGLFFRSAHIHYGKFSKANVWVIGMVMFWLMFNYGLLAAIMAHILYDLCVFTAIAISSPLQPRAAAET